MAKILELGNFFPWDVHPNVLRARLYTRKKLIRRLSDYTKTPEYVDYTNGLPPAPVCIL